MPNAGSSKGDLPAGVWMRRATKLFADADIGDDIDDAPVGECVSESLTEERRGEKYGPMAVFFHTSGKNDEKSFCKRKNNGNGKIVRKGQIRCVQLCHGRRV